MKIAISLLLFAARYAQATQSQYVLLGSGYCKNYAYLPEGPYPNLLESTATFKPEYNNVFYDASDSKAECMNLCKAAAGQEGSNGKIISGTSFYLKNSGSKCACATDSCSSRVTHSSYTSYAVLRSHRAVKIGSGYCSDWKYLPEGAYPNLLTTSHAMYSAQSTGVQECMDRCIRAADSDTAISTKAFYLKNGKCGCSKGSCLTQSGTSGSTYTSYAIVRHGCVPFTEEACKVAAYTHGLPLADPFKVKFSSTSYHTTGHNVHGCTKAGGKVYYGLLESGDYQVNYPDLQSYHTNTYIYRITGADCRAQKTVTNWQAVCLPYSKDACKDLAESLNFKTTSAECGGWNFEGDNGYTPGCYAYTDSATAAYRNCAFYGRGRNNYPRDFLEGRLDVTSGLSGDKIRLLPDCTNPLDRRTL